MRRYAILVAAISVSLGVHALLVEIVRRGYLAVSTADSVVATSSADRLNVHLSNVSSGRTKVAVQSLIPTVPGLASITDIPQKNLESNSAVPATGDAREAHQMLDEHAFLRPDQVDRQAEFLGAVDFDAALRGLPLVTEVVRVLVFVDSHGVVQGLRWEKKSASSEVMDRLGGCIAAQPLIPAKSHGRDVASRLRLELEIGASFRRPDDIAVLPEGAVSAPVGR